MVTSNQPQEALESFSDMRDMDPSAAAWRTEHFKRSNSVGFNVKFIENSKFLSEWTHLHMKVVSLLQVEELIWI